MDRDAILTWLEVLAALLVVAGVGGGLFPVLGWFALVPAGLVSALCSWGLGSVAARHSEGS